MDDAKVCFYVCPLNEVNNFIIDLFLTDFMFLLPTDFNGSVMLHKVGYFLSLRRGTYGGIQQHFFSDFSWSDAFPFSLCQTVDIPVSNEHE